VKDLRAYCGVLFGLLFGCCFLQPDMLTLVLVAGCGPLLGARLGEVVHLSKTYSACLIQLPSLNNCYGYQQFG